MSEYPIIMYGINVEDLNMQIDIKKFQDMLTDDMEIRKELSSKGFSWVITYDATYVGISPRYSWEPNNLYLTIEAADNAIADFIDQYVFNTKEEIIAQIDDIEDVGWNY